MAAPLIATPRDLVPLLRGLGPPPLGNPQAARAYATELRRAAEALHGSARLYAVQAHVQDFEGGAAGRHAHAVQGGHQALTSHADRLDHLANHILHEAAALEQAQHAWRTRARQRAAAAPGMLLAALRMLGWRMP